MSTFEPSRPLFRSMLNNDLIIRVPTYTGDGMGGSTQTLSVGTKVRGRLRPMKPEEIETALRMDAKADHILYCEPTDIPKDAIVELVGRPEQYRVIGVQEPGYAEFFYQVVLRREI